MTELLPVLLVVGMTATGVMAVFFLVRDIRDRRRAEWQRRVVGDEESEPVALVGYAAGPEAAPNWSARMDSAFAQMVHETGLGWGPEQALALMALASVVLAGLLFLWRGELWLIALGLVVGIALPLAIYLLLRQRWRQRLQDQLPDAFFLIARSLRAGETLEQALDMVASHGTKPLAGEFRQAVERIKLGLTVPAALQGMARRLRLPDFNVFVTAVTLHRNIGGNLTMLLDRVAASTRDRNQFRGYVRAATALARITGIAVAAAAPLLFVGYALWQPEFITRFTDSVGGVRALTVAAVLEVLGIIWLYFLLRFDY
jgi:tight adherence protein B